MDQTLTDVNTEFSDFQLFVCSQEQRLLSMDILDPAFDRHCPLDGSGLVRVDHLVTPNCPRCGTLMGSEQLKPLATTDTSAE